MVFVKTEASDICCYRRSARPLKRKHAVDTSDTMPKKVSKGSQTEDCPDAEYQSLLKGYSGSSKWKQFVVAGLNVAEDGTNDEEDDLDPQYVLFMEKLREDSKSYVLEVSGDNNIPVFLKYEAEDESDEEGDQTIWNKKQGVLDGEEVEAGNHLVNSKPHRKIENCRISTACHCGRKRNPIEEGLRRACLNPDSRKINEHPSKIEHAIEESDIFEPQPLHFGYDPPTSRKMWNVQKMLSNLQEKGQKIGSRRQGLNHNSNEAAEYRGGKFYTKPEQTNNNFDNTEEHHEVRVGLDPQTPRKLRKITGGIAIEVVNHLMDTENGASVEAQRISRNVGGVGKVENRKTLTPCLVSKGINLIVDGCYQSFLDSIVVEGGYLIFEQNGKRVKYEDEAEFAEDSSDSEILMWDASPYGGEEKDNPFVKAKTHIDEVDGRFRKKVMSILSQPYNQNEYRTLLKDINEQKLVRQHVKDLRGRSVSFSVDGTTKSYLDHHTDLKKKLDGVRRDRRKALNILRGFFFWLEHVATEEGLFKPWLDASCLAMIPPSL